MMKRRFRARRFSASGSLMSFRLKVRSLREVPEPPFGAGALRLRGAKNGGVVNGKFPDAGLCAVGTQHRLRAVSASRPAELCARGEQNEKTELTKGHMTRPQLRGEPKPVDSLSGGKKRSALLALRKMRRSPTPEKDAEPRIRVRPVPVRAPLTWQPGKNRL